MADLFPSLASRVLPRLGQSPAQREGLREWFTRGAYNGGLDPVTSDVLLGNVNPGELISYFSHDYERFALASWESFQVATLESHQNSLVAWPLLKMYYAAFFAAHALMRSVGEAIVKVDRQQTDAINVMVAAATGGSPNLTPGMYQCTIEEVRPGQLEVRMSPHTEGFGVHDGFWKAYANHLDANAARAANEASPDANTFLAGVSEVTPKVRGWLAARRNDINYQQAFGVWYPLTKGKILNSNVEAVKRLDSRSVDLSSPPHVTIPAFIAITQYLACLNAEVADHLAARSKASGTFGSKWSRFQATMLAAA